MKSLERFQYVDSIRITIGTGKWKGNSKGVDEINQDLVKVEFCIFSTSLDWMLFDDVFDWIIYWCYFRNCILSIMYWPKLNLDVQGLFIYPYYSLYASAMKGT